MDDTFDKKIGSGRAAPAPEMQRQDDRVILEDLVLQIAQSLTDTHRARWEETDDDNAMRETIVTTLNKIGHPAEGLPGVLPHILKMLEIGEIDLRSTRNGLPPIQVSDVSANLASWYLSSKDADKVRLALGHPSAADALARQPADEPGLSRRERQIRSIESAIATLGYSALKVPTGGKGKVKSECKRAALDLFGVGDDPFKAAWQEALNQSRVRTVNHDKYIGK